MFLFSNTVISYAFASEPDLMNKKMVEIFIRYANMNKNDRIFREVWIAQKAKLLKDAGII